MESNGVDEQMKLVEGASGYVLEDVPHLSDYIHHLPVLLLPLSLFFVSVIRFSIDSSLKSTFLWIGVLKPSPYTSTNLVVCSRFGSCVDANAKYNWFFPYCFGLLMIRYFYTFFCNMGL